MTKKQLESEVKERIYSLPLGKIESPHKEYFITLFKRHPEYESKCGIGIHEIVLSQNRLNKSARELYIVRKDGSTIDISWRRCVSGNPPTKHSLLMAAMRRAVRDHIIAFAKGLHNCDNCGTDIGPFEVDHCGPDEFKSLAEAWQKMKGAPPSFDDCAESNSAKFWPSDLAYEMGWRYFHNDLAKLQLLCKPCHNLKTIQSKK
jgi:5-methylcytosine-specific restriction endonuclease McrA